MQPRYRVTALLAAALLGMAGVTGARTIIVSLNELVGSSTTIALVDLDPVATSADRLRFAPTFKVVVALKGAIRAGSSIRMCDPEPMRDNPTFSEPVGRFVVFAHQRDACFSWAWSGRSVVRVTSAEVHTIALDGEPDDQPLEQFMARIRAIVSKGRKATPDEAPQGTRASWRDRLERQLARRSAQAQRVGVSPAGGHRPNNRLKSPSASISTP